MKNVTDTTKQPNLANSHVVSGTGALWRGSLTIGGSASIVKPSALCCARRILEKNYCARVANCAMRAKFILRREGTGHCKGQILGLMMI